ncbi:hypothetical protein HNQ59_003766 [Chitinivorax tropicus]|uniref:Toxin CptA n=1 Tax=Chitinivorax tropicus TaxID=714531 RepID=A0A840MTA2_9PROT|nr:protein YgfX [Chitinivorax tropicus]MBB5020447.1 hypothetical protein [Chitinivorax tropicus]
MLRLEIRSSPLLAGLVQAMHGLAVCATLLASAIPLSIRLLAVGLVLASAVWHWRHRAIQHIDGLEINARDQVSIAVDQRWQPALIRGDSLVTSTLMILVLQTDTKIHRLVMLPDQVEHEASRRLRVWLKWRWRVDLAANPHEVP